MVEKVMRYANETNKSFCLNIDSEWALRNMKDEILQCLECADFVFIDKNEVLAMVETCSEELGYEELLKNSKKLSENKFD